MDNAPLEAAVENTVVQEPSKIVEEVKTDTSKVEETVSAEPEDTKQEPEAEPVEETVEELKKRLETAEKNFHKRIGRKTAAAKAQEARAANLEKQLQDMQQNAKPQDDSPKEDDYQTFDEYHDARIKHEAKQLAQQEIAQHKQAELQQIQQKEQFEKQQRFTKSEHALRERVTDFDDVADQAEEAIKDMTQQGVNLKPFVDSLYSFDDGAAILYQLSKNDAIEEVAAMKPVDMMRELVRIELSQNTVAKKETKKAPSPIKPVSSKGSKSLGQKTGKDIMDWVNS